MKKGKQCEKIIVTLRHSIGDVEVPLELWLQKGPGERRFVAPISVKCADNGQKLPLSTIPLKYRNNWISRLLISLKVIDDPWHK